MMKCLFCDNDVNDKSLIWDESRAIEGIINEWPKIPNGGTYIDCDMCYGLLDRFTFFDAEIWIRDNDWNWQKI